MGSCNSSSKPDSPKSRRSKEPVLSSRTIQQKSPPRISRSIVSKSPKKTVNKASPKKSITSEYHKRTFSQPDFAPKSPQNNKRTTKFSLGNAEMLLEKTEDNKPNLEFFEIPPKKNYEYFKLIEESDQFKIFKVISASNQRKLKIRNINISNNQNGFLLDANNIHILKKLNYPFIQKYYDAFKYQNQLYTVTELNSNGFLSSKINEKYEFSELHAGVILYQLLLAVVYMNKNNIIHRNIKPENIFIADYLIEDKFFFVKLSDFRQAKYYLKSEMETEFVGTAFFVAPEVILNSYNDKCDVWSLGIILYTLIGGSPPFVGNSQAETLEKIKTNQMSFSKKFSIDSIRFIKDLLEKVPEDRISAEQALKHPFFEKANVKERFRLTPKKIYSILERFNEIHFDIKQEFIINISDNFTLSKEIFDRIVIFNMIDKNRDGLISYNDILEEFFKDYKPEYEIITKNINNVFNNLKLIGAKSINFNEFARYTIDRSLFIENIDLLYYEVKYSFGSTTGKDINKLFHKGDMEVYDKLTKVYNEKKMSLSASLSLEEFEDIFRKMIV